MHQLLKRSPLAIFVVVCAMVLHNASEAADTKIQSADGVRTWTDITGRFKTEAEFVAAKDGQVTLKKSDGRSQVVNVERRMTLWRYEGIHTDGVTFGGRYWTVLGGGPHGKCYVPFKMPHDEALKAIDAVPPEDLLVVKPGDKIKLVVKLGFAAEQQKKIADLLAERLRKNGFVLAEDARLVFEATAEQGDPATVQYEDIRFPRRVSSVQVNENSYQMRIKEGKDVIWQTGGRTDAPPLVMIEQGQTIDDALSSFNGLNLPFFEKTNIPKQIARPGKHGGVYGISRVTSSGIVTTHRP